MGNMVETVKRMNEMLKGKEFPTEQFEALVKTIQEQFKSKFSVLDFEYYNEQRLAWAHVHKQKSLENQNFEAAASCRDLEIECQRHIEIYKNYDRKESAFLYEENNLLYLYFGNQVQDKAARLCMNKFITTVRQKNHKTLKLLYFA